MEKRRKRTKERQRFALRVTACKKDEKERKKDNVSPLGLHQVRDRLEKTKGQTKYKQYKEEKLRRQKLTGR